MKGGDYYCSCHLTNEETEAQRKHLSPRVTGLGMMEPGFPPFWIISLSLFSVQRERISSISGQVLCIHGTSEGDRKSQFSWDRCHVLE